MITTISATITERANLTAIWSAIILGFSVAVSVALDSALLMVIVLAWLIGANFRQKMTRIFANPVAVAALVLFGLLLVGSAYGKGPASEALRYLSKYREILLIALLVPLFHNPVHRRRVFVAFMLAMGVTVLLSYAVWLGLIGPSRLLHGAADNPAVFKLQITHSVFVAFAAYLWALEARQNPSARLRRLCAVLALLASFNVLFMVQSRTGVLVLAALGVYFLFAWKRWIGLGSALLALLGIGLAAYQTVPQFSVRFDRIAEGYRNWQPGAENNESVALRIDYYRNTLSIIRDHPLLGVGTGGFPTAYGEKIQGTANMPSVNPHNQFLLITAQLGVVGLAALLYLFFAQWRHAAWLASEQETHIARGLVIMIVVGCLFNSLLIDHAERVFFALASGVLFAGWQRGVQPAN